MIAKHNEMVKECPYTQSIGTFFDLLPTLLSIYKFAPPRTSLNYP
ncbi:hypothetical protein SBF1_200016 [Candidatus Desulfosporosinus infrequens]|uniref:Uncharacterized protein n=1 Tax=Candidatus Desulfosporosinus infrequens TaxID=2043169 RepID=A0A2U3KH47_9FIRM|nr:hypothetical protein SBF1_200016 [Candidatus Desulfosporosinus infrequens]